MTAEPENTPNCGDNDVVQEDVPLSELVKDSSDDTGSSNNHNIAITRRLVIYSFITIFVMLTTTIILIAVSINVTSETTNSSEEYRNIMFTKTEWGGRPALNLIEPLHHPVKYVVISHTAGQFCTNFTECAAVLQSFQAHQMVDLNMPDIEHNFFIGGDGNVYEGRGWNKRNVHLNNISVSFIGNYLFDTLTTRMISALKELLDLGVKLNKLSPDYMLICLNQTHSTLSPGENVYKEIKKFSHYYRPGHVQIKDI